MAKKNMTPPPPASKKKKAKKGFSKPKSGFRPPKIVLVGVEGWGKTSLVSYIDDVAILMPEAETGYLTLFGAGRVPKVDCLVTTTWKETLDAIDAAKGHKALALDELSGLEKQAQEYICQNEYGGKWSAFWHYHKGMNLVVPEWRKFLAKLEKLDITIVALCHCSIQNFKNNPMVGDHDRYVGDLHKTVWAESKQWSDAALFGTFAPVVDDEGKGIGGDERLLYTEHRDTHDAKNRYGLEPEIDIPDDPAEVWPLIDDMIRGKE